MALSLASATNSSNTAELKVVPVFANPLTRKHIESLPFKTRLAYAFFDGLWGGVYRRYQYL
jgi:hypothetical protein